MASGITMEFLGYLIAAFLLVVLVYRGGRSGRDRRASSAASPVVDSQLELALWASGEELWDLDVASGRLVRQGRIPDLDLDPDRRRDRTHPVFTGSLEANFATVHPDDRDAVADTMQRVTSGAIEHAGMSYRVRVKSGGWIWLHSHGRAVARSSDGQVTRVMGTTRNVDSLKLNEERLGFALRAAGEELWEVHRHVDEIRRENPVIAIDYAGGDTRMTRTEFAALLHPDDVDKVTQSFFAVLSGASPEFSAIYRLRRKDGRYAWIDSQGRGLDSDESGRPRRVLGISRDITALKANEDRLRLSLWGSRAELWDIDMSTGMIQRECGLEHLVLGENTIQFADVLQLAHVDDTAPLRNGMVDHAKGTIESFDASYRVLDVYGNWRWVLARGRVTERTADGRAVRMLGTLHDITEIKRAEDELRRLNEELEERVALRTKDLSRSNSELSRTVERLSQAQAQLVQSEKLASLGSLVAGVAHEINTPLGISVTAASHLSEEIGALEDQLRLSPPSGVEITRRAQVIRQCADLVLRNLDRADKLVKSFKQVAVDQSSEQVREIVLKDYCDEIVLSLNPRLKRTGHRIELDCSPSIRLVTYPGAIYQTITNLVVNSVVHGFEGVDSGIISIVASTTPDQVVIDYRDNGRGMSASARKRVFDPFFTTRRGQGGTGLGMHIVYNLVTQLLGGSIRCESEPGAGVRFEVRIPRVARGEVAAIPA